MRYNGCFPTEWAELRNKEWYQEGKIVPTVCSFKLQNFIIVTESVCKKGRGQNLALSPRCDYFQRKSSCMNRTEHDEMPRIVNLWVL